MNWKLRHQGSPKTISGLDPQRIVEGLQDGQWEVTDEVLSPGDENWVPIQNHPQFAEIVEDLEAPLLAHDHEETHVDMIPLIDVTQVLLIFFILSSTYASNPTMIEAPGVSADKVGPPQVSKEEVESTMIVVRVSQTAQGEPVVRVEKEIVPLDEVAGALKQHKGAAKKRILLIDSDPRVPHGVIVALQDAAKAANMEKVLFAVPAKEAPGPKPD